MKLISLNTWGGRAGKDKLLAFFEHHKDVDIFCLQEIWSAPYEHLNGHAAGGLEIDHDNIMVYGKQEISALLNSHTPYFRPLHLNDYGLLMLIKQDITVVEEGEEFVYKERGWVSRDDIGDHARSVQYATIETPKGLRTIMNIHGLWHDHGKDDCEDRLCQSDNIARFIQRFTHPIVLCGDFNLSPDTESVAKLEATKMHNLIKEYGVTSTRTSYYKKEQRYADYTFVSGGIDVKDFKVLPDEVSDHSPMYLEFE